MHKKIATRQFLEFVLQELKIIGVMEASPLNKIWTLREELLKTAAKEEYNGSLSFVLKSSGNHHNILVIITYWSLSPMKMMRSA